MNTIMNHSNQEVDDEYQLSVVLKKRNLSLTQKCGKPWLFLVVRPLTDEQKL